MAQTGTGQDHRGVMRIVQVQGNSAGYEFALPWLYGHAAVDAGAQVNPGGARCGVGGGMFMQARVENLYINFFHCLLPFL
jgi:hypothetical protein